MLAKKYRLPWRIKFEKDALFFSSDLFNLRVRQNSLLYNRYAVLVGKKIDKRATVRNRIRRLIYTAIGELFEKSQKGLDFLFIIKKTAIGKGKKDFVEAINLLKDKVF